MRLNLRTKCALSVRITGDVCTYLASFVRGKGTNPKEIWRVWRVRLAVLITAAVSSPAYRFLLVQFKTNKLCIGESLII